jgi:parvulin-like peptidyl-prolyl isomerase
MRHTLAAVLALGLLVSAHAIAENGVVANLGSEPVKVSDLRDYVPALNPAQRQQAEKDPKVGAQVVRMAVARKLIVAEAEKQGWDKKPDIAAQIARARQDVIFDTYVRSVATPPASYPSDAEIKAAYDANHDKFMTAQQYHLSQIFVIDPKEGGKAAASAAERKARDLGKKAKTKGADFSEIASANSDDTNSASHGGDLGWLAENQIVPEILSAVKAMGDKGISEPIHVAGGWHILWVMATKPAELLPLDQVRDAIVTALRQSKITQEGQAYIDKLLADRHLAVNENAAGALLEAPK